MNHSRPILSATDHAHRVLDGAYAARRVGGGADGAAEEQQDSFHHPEQSHHSNNGNSEYISRDSESETNFAEPWGLVKWKKQTWETAVSLEYAEAVN
jgi:hypothetical protein